MEPVNEEKYETPIERMRRLQSPHRAAVSKIVAKLHSAYIVTDRDLDLDKRIQEMIDHYIRVTDARAEGLKAGRLAEARPMFMIGPSGSGKTRALARVFQKKEDFKGYGDPNSDCPLVSVDVPSPCSMRMLGERLARKLGYVSVRKHQESEIWDIVSRLLERRGVSFVHFDEVGHVLTCKNSVEIQKVRDTFKSLMVNTEWPVWLILSGTPVIAQLADDPEEDNDEQVWRRALPYVFEDLDFRKDAGFIQNVLVGLGQDKAGLRVDGITNDPFAARLVHAGINRLGIVIELTQDAAEAAVDANASSLQIEHFAHAYWKRTGCTPETNVFTRDDWEVINPRLALRGRDGRLLVEPSQTERPSKKRRRR